MNDMFYPKLAAINIKKNSRTYIPYILSCIGTISMYYIMVSLSTDGGLHKMPGAESLKSILSLGSYVIAVFAAIFLFYTNSFLIKRRKKEFGLFNILGMEKKHISRIMFYETLYTAIISLTAGILTGILLNRLIYLLLLKLTGLTIQMKFELSINAITACLVLFGAVFLLMFLNAMRQIHLSKPVELLKGGQVGEKEPKTKLWLTILGVLTLGAGYTIALTTESPIEMLGLFFIAVILVIIGTYCLFTAGSIAVLKLLRKNRNYYYQTRHFISVSGMIYRMKQNAAGLANICILSTMVLVMLSTSVSMYIGVDDVLRTRYPRNIFISAGNVSDTLAEQMDKAIVEEAGKLNSSVDDPVRHRFMYFLAVQEGDSFTPYLHDTVVYPSGMSGINCITLSDYNKTYGHSYALGQNEVLVHAAKGASIGDVITIGDLKLSVKGRVSDLETDTISEQALNSYDLVLPDTEVIKHISGFLSAKPTEMSDLSYYYGFDSNASAQTQIELTSAINKRVKELGIRGYAEGAEASRSSFYALYGGLLFLGIFLGTLFIMATVLIIYYKQISEGYDDKERFEIMQKVGMSRDEVKKSIKSQVLLVFFLPLITAGIHVAAAFKAITKILALLNLTNITLFAWGCAGTLLIFGLFYAIVYALTSRVYYRIVSQA